ncbi:HAD family hydrolase [bacterium]|nr:HAD family hydrolase [bacterium]
MKSSRNSDNQISLLLLDLDGTLLNGKLSIGKRTSEAIRSLSKKGVNTTLVTGRMLSAVKRYADSLRVTSPIIALNGAYIADPDARCILLDKRIPKPVPNEILQKLKDLPLAVNIILGKRAISSNLDDLSKKAVESWLANIQFIDRIDVVSENPNMMLFLGDENNIKEACTRLEPFRSKVVIYSYASIRYKPKWYVEVRPAGTSKGKAVELLLKYLEVSPQNVLSVGDFLNDMPMLKLTGHSACVANAHPEVKTAVDYVSHLSNDQEGVFDILKQFGLV